MSTVNLKTKYSPRVAERIAKRSITEGAASTEYDFTGVKGITISSVDVVALGNYNRSSTSGYGTPSELGDAEQYLEMTQDKAFTYKIDKGNEEEQLDIKKANQTLKREIDEVIVPTLDKYRLEQWCRKAGSVASLAAVNNNSIIGLVMDCTEKLDNALTPEEGRVMYIKTSGYKALKQAPNFVYTDKLAQDSLVNGQVGMLDNMPVIKVPSSYLPAGVEWLITYKHALLAPQKLADYKIHIDPPGISGHLVEGRLMHGAFVIGSKANHVCVGINSNYAINAPTLAWDNTNSKVTVASTTAGVDLYYTTDGSDPRYSNSKTTIAANAGTITFATLNSASTDSNGHCNVRAAAVPNSNTSLFQSEVSNVFTYA